jgi:hypothetical protein
VPACALRDSARCRADAAWLTNCAALHCVRRLHASVPGRLFKFLTRFEGAANLGRIVLLLLLLMLLLHWLATVFFLIASQQGGWLYENICTAAASADAPPTAPSGPASSPNCDHVDPASLYVFTYYYTTLMLMGDDVGPVTGWEAAFISMVIVIGACVNATIFANVASLVQQLSALSAQHQANMDSVDRAMCAQIARTAARRRVALRSLCAHRRCRGCVSDMRATQSLA